MTNHIVVVCLQKIKFLKSWLPQSDAVMFQLLTCLLLLTWRDETTVSAFTRSKRQERQRFQNFPAVSPDQFNSDRYQTSFSDQFVQSQQQQFRQQQQPEQQQQGLSLPGSGRSLFDQIVNRINTGHRENARRKKIQDKVDITDLN